MFLPTMYLEKVALNNIYKKKISVKPQILVQLAVSAWDGSVAQKITTRD